MSTCFRAGHRAQRGDVLLEALVGVLMTAIIGAGLAHVATRIAVSQRDAKVENLVVERLRAQLQTQGLGLCGAGGTVAVVDLPSEGPVEAEEGGAVSNSIQATVDCTDTAEVAVSAGGAAPIGILPPREIQLKVASSAVGLDGTDLLVATKQ